MLKYDASVLPEGNTLPGSYRACLRKLKVGTPCVPSCPATCGLEVGVSCFFATRWRTAAVVCVTCASMAAWPGVAILDRRTPGKILQIR